MEDIVFFVIIRYCCISFEKNLINYVCYLKILIIIYISNFYNEGFI